MADEHAPSVTHPRFDSTAHAAEAASAARRDVQWRFYLVSGLAWFATVLPMPVNVLLATSRGFGLDDVGMFMGLYAATVAALEVPTGGLADAIGRKRVALGAIALQAAATAVFLVAFSLPVLLAYAVLLGTARALGSGALSAWFVDALQSADPDVDLQPPLALAGTTDLIALAAGTLTGGALPMAFGSLPADGSAILTPLATTLVASIALQAIAFVATLVLVVEARPAWRERHGTGGGATGGRGGERARLGMVLRDAVRLVRGRPVLGLLLGAQATAGFALLGMETFWQPYLDARLGAADERTWIFGAVLAGAFVAGMIGNLAAVPAARWFGGRYARLAGAAVALQAVALAALAWAPTATAAIPLFWAAYFSMGAAVSPIATIFHGEVPSERRSAMLSVQSLAGFAGSFGGTVALGLVAEATSVAMAWFVAGGGLAFGAVLLSRSDRVMHRPRASTSDVERAARPSA